MDAVPTEKTIKDLNDYRIDYSKIPLKIEEFANCPFEQFKTWFETAEKTEKDVEVNSMAIATCSKDGMPSVRYVLCKGFDKNGFVFYTNYESKKGKQIEENPKIAALFYWPNAQRQVRIEGKAEKISEEASDTYFNSRPIGSQISGSLSPQSQVISSKQELQAKMDEIKKQVEDDVTKVVRPKNWGGYRIIPISFEFWQGQSSRFHDRFLYTPLDDSNNNWNINILAP